MEESETGKEERGRRGWEEAHLRVLRSTLVSPGCLG